MSFSCLYVCAQDLLTIEMLVVVLFRPQAVLDDQAVRAREVRHSCRIQVTTANMKALIDDRIMGQCTLYSLH